MNVRIGNLITGSFDSTTAEICIAQRFLNKSPDVFTIG